MRALSTVLIAVLVCVVLVASAGALPNNGSNSCINQGWAVWEAQFIQTHDSCWDSNQRGESPDPVGCSSDCVSIAEHAANYFANQYYNACTGQYGGSTYCSPSSPWC